MLFTLQTLQGNSVGKMASKQGVTITGVVVVSARMGLALADALFKGEGDVVGTFKTWSNVSTYVTA